VELAAEYLNLRRPLLDAAWKQRPTPPIRGRSIRSAWSRRAPATTPPPWMPTGAFSSLAYSRQRRYNLAAILTKLSRRPEATQEYELLTASVPTFAPAFHNLAPSQTGVRQP